ncbi:hypothetical protein HO611_03440 [Streptococcus suis]|nr:hypothetical protein [Streptococcus suis]
MKIRLGDADADRTEVHQIKSTTSDFDFRCAGVGVKQSGNRLFQLNN